MFGSCWVKKMKVNTHFLAFPTWLTLKAPPKVVCSVLPDIFYALTCIAENFKSAFYIHEIILRSLPTTPILFNAQATFLEFPKFFYVFWISLILLGSVIVFNLVIPCDMFFPPNSCKPCFLVVHFSMIKVCLCHHASPSPHQALFE